jgi:hypothetical protein
MRTVISSFPCLAPARGGELCFLSSTPRDKRIQCNIFGHVTMNTNWKGWEVWCLSKVEGSDDGTFIVTSWTHDRKVLCSDPDGTVRTTENPGGEWEKWRVQKHSERGVILRSVAHEDRVLWTNGHKIRTECYDGGSNNEDCLWCLEPAHTNHFFVSSNASDKRIGCTPDRAVFTTDNRKEWEHWVVEFVGAGAVVIKSHAHHHNEARFLTVEDGSTVTMGHDPFTWQVELSPHGGVTFCSTAGKKFLTCNSGVEGVTLVVVEARDVDDKSTSWNLEPRMPTTISANQIWALTGAGLFGLVTVIAAPFAVVGIVGAMGFGTGGIVAGSAAAGMMSAEAIAVGGGVVAGGTVATLQSIGAVGLGVAGTSAAMAGGAVLGSAVIGGTGALVLGPEDRETSNSLVVDPHSGPHGRPLASWRSW